MEVTSGAGLPAPLVAAEVDLRDFAFMPLDVVRLRDSELVAEESPEACWAALLLWGASWHQVPAGSIPDSDQWQAKQTGVQRRRWARIRHGALRGWVKCSDGRLYHPWVADMAFRAWTAKQRRQAKLNRRLQIESGEWDAIRSEVYARDDYTCRYCGTRGERLECDHVVPVSRGGETTLENLVTACRPCNRSKGAKPLDQWRGYRGRIAEH